MKMLTLIAALTFFSAMAHAEKTVAQATDVDDVIASVSLSDTGVVTVHKRNETSATLKLSPSNRQRLVYLANALGDSPVVVDHKTIVCMMMIRQFSLQDLLTAGTENTELHLVLSSQSCAIANTTRPADPYAMQDAAELKGQLIVLAHQIAHN